MDQEQTPPVTMTTPVRFLPGVGAFRAEKYARLGLRTAQNVLFFFPRDYERPAPPKAVDKLREGEQASLIGTITDAELASRSPGKSVFGAIVENETGAVRILFFNQPYRADQIKFGQRVVISGAPKLSGLRMEFVHPQLTMLDEQDNYPEPKILAIYALTEGVKQNDLRHLVGNVLELLGSEIHEVMPERLRRDSADALRAAGIEIEGPLYDIQTAVRQLHQPDNEASLQAARIRLVFQELFVMQLALAMRRRKLTSDLQSPPLSPTSVIDSRILNRFPFELTNDQRQAIKEVSQDMACQFPMNRMLQGDVGSGKTVVAVYAMMLAVANGHQSVMMAPTEVLARQHYETLRKILADSRVRIGLLCGSISRAERAATIQAAASGEIDLLVGTQALLYGDIQFHKLGLCVIDEQHKFGVGQRVTLRSGGVDPHYLVMSATPIPRSMAMTLFGDVELSTLREKPPGRATVNTYLAHDGWKDRWWSFVRERLNEGRQAFVVAPRVVPTTKSEEEDSDDEEGEDISSVQTVFADLSKGVLSEFRIGLLHGRMSADEKMATMQEFASGEIDVLVSTTVIEVGIDVPNATVMTILGAERFGLAQLHQLRGRVSRGSHVGHVCVFSDGDQPPSENERLSLFEKTNDGFELAEADFELRGPGDLLGRKQSGMAPLRIADPRRDIEILRVARELAQTIIEEDPELDAEDFQDLKSQVMRRYGRRLNLGDVA
ncbi:ATP-dependent DNA helicase RecG [Novipirellula rosea]|uniref:Probable DNA 3'-5' helicase RecG n=1 Tax=Novipirellula rosea TaxID=1031540 RepID=A0ABP8NDJ5_9BACT